MRRNKRREIRLGNAPLGNYIVPLLLAVWYTVLCAGFAYLYWFVGYNDVRDIFGPVLSNLGAILVFPVGWIGLLLSIEP